MPARTTSDDQLTPIVAALQAHGPISAGRLAETLGIPYPTLTPRLRRLEADGRAERVHDTATRQSTWQATATTDTPPGDESGQPTPPDPKPDRSSDEPAAPPPHDRREPVDGTADSIAEPASTGGLRHAPPPASPDPEPAPPPTASVGERRPKGSISADLLAVVRACPDQPFKISQLSKALDGTSAGAIANAASKLVVSGELLLVCEKPATYQAA